MVIFGIASIGNLALNILLIPRFGAVGSAVIAVGTEYGISVMYAILYGRSVPRAYVKQSEDLVDIA